MGTGKPVLILGQLIFVSSNILFYAAGETSTQITEIKFHLLRVSHIFNVP